MLRKILFVITIIIIYTPQCFAFDGIRKGFTLGGGINFTPYSKWEFKTPPLSKHLLLTV